MQCCRLCVQSADICVSFVSDTEESNKLLSDLFLCTQIKLKNVKNAPYSVCRSCLHDLTFANTFRIKCLTAQKDLSDSTHIPGTFHPKDEPKKVEFEASFEISSNDGYYNEEKSIENTSDAGSNIYQCDLCNKQLKSNKSLQKHKTLMHEKRKHVGRVTGSGVARRFHCKECSFSSPHSQTLVNHVRRHNGEKPFVCQCGKSFGQSATLTSHLKLHSNDAQFTCSICGKQFKLAQALKRHMTVHEEGNWSCPQCQKQLKSKESLKYHMIRHKNIRNYSCDECGSTFVTSSELINHKKKHSKEKLMKCNFCDYKTCKKNVLILHLKRHTGIKTLKCSLCEASFYTNSELRTHQRVHTRVKPYPCPLCAQHFTHSSSVNKHVHTVHGKEFKWSMRWRDAKYEH